VLIRSAELGGYVTHFQVRAEFTERYEVRQAKSSIFIRSHRCLPKSRGEFNNTAGEVIMKYDKDEVDEVVLTVYRPDPKRWISWRKRRRENDAV